MTDGRLVILSGPSYVGKSPLAKALAKFYPELRKRLQPLVVEVGLYKPFVVSVVEPPIASLQRTKIGIVEGWNDGLMGSKPNTPIFQHSISLICL